MPDIIAAIAAIADAAAAVSKEITQRDAEKNAPAIVAAAITAEEQAVVDQLRKDTANENVAATEKEIAAPDVTAPGGGK